MAIRPDQPLIILPADDPPKSKLNWVIREYIGSEICKSLEPGPDGYPVPLTRFEDLQEGDEVYTWSGAMKFTVRKSPEDGHLYGDCGRWRVILGFAEDDRKCWVASGFVNLRALKKLSVHP